MKRQDSMADADQGAPRATLQAVLDARAALLDPARPEAVARQRRRGRWTVREAVAALADPDSFVEYGGLVRPALPGMAGAADGMVMGHAQVGGRAADIVGYDYTVYAGKQSANNHAKIGRMTLPSLIFGRVRRGSGAERVVPRRAPRPLVSPGRTQRRHTFAPGRSRH